MKRSKSYFWSNFKLFIWDFQHYQSEFLCEEKAGNIALAVGLGAILNIVLNFMLIPKYGIYGAGIASILAFGLIVIFNFVIAEKRIGLDTIFFIYSPQSLFLF